MASTGRKRKASDEVIALEVATRRVAELELLCASQQDRIAALEVDNDEIMECVMEKDRQLEMALQHKQLDVELLLPELANLAADGLHLWAADPLRSGWSDLTKVDEYSEKSFLEAAAHAGCGVFYRFIHLALSRAQELCRRQRALSSPRVMAHCAAREAALSTFRREKAESHIIQLATEYVNPQYISTGSYIIGMVVRCMTKCTSAVDLLARYLSGGTCFTTYQRHMTELVQDWDDSQLPIPIAATAVFGYDNNTDNYRTLSLVVSGGASSARVQSAAQIAARVTQMAQLVAAGMPDVIGPQVPLDFVCWENGVEPPFPKICPRCRMSYSKSTIKCLQTGCREEDPRASLPLIDEMRKKYGKRDGGMHFRPTNMPIQQVSRGSLLHTMDTSGLVESQLLGACTTWGEYVLALAPERGYFGFSVKTESETLIFRHTLKSKLANPASNEVKKELLIEAGELLSLRGFAKAGTPHQHVRQFAFDLADQRATFTQKEGRFENWVHLMGHFHECKMFLECCMDSFRLLGGEHLIARFNCGMSEKQVGS
ncbi:hypothetical protein B484DRAFT_405499 [Ochromonadaceae sp. CCMP2298]|nr:hypothetical protein B484DRAFT_405499 [Ochromonadaceae sp. CCMP2298]